MNQKDEKARNLIKELAAKFMQLESNYTSMITVTDVTLSDSGKQATVFFTVLPEEKEAAALDFTKRKRSEFREYIKDKSRLNRIPFFDFMIDVGEKNRQKIDYLSHEHGV